jgi:hypothetical protein
MDNIDKEFLKKYLNDKTLDLPLGEKLKIAFKIQYEYWKDRLDPPNLPFETFILLVDKIPDSIPDTTWEKRLSDKGEFSDIGEDVIFQFVFSINFAGRKQEYYLKGYFFEKGYTRGIVIQSFRANEIKKTTKRLKVIK